MSELPLRDHYYQTLTDKTDSLACSLYGGKATTDRDDGVFLGDIIFMVRVIDGIDRGRQSVDRTRSGTVEL